MFEKALVIVIFAVGFYMAWVIMGIVGYLTSWALFTYERSILHEILGVPMGSRAEWRKYFRTNEHGQKMRRRMILFGGILTLLLSLVDWREPAPRPKNDSGNAGG